MSEVLGALVGDAWARRRAGKTASATLVAPGTVESAVRALDGELPGLTRDRTRGRWSVGPGCLSVRDVLVEVDAVAQSIRRPSFREFWTVDQVRPIPLHDGTR
ncbi:hypothetical protein [Actinotalea sp. C106]|uniref:hypothetical protein n=1 Tax=Actinotalea sp. C106 TaxID=2908644 RepID=UPI0020292FEC|nr:hypothetical protein [Actinotalea sp. C106]